MQKTIEELLKELKTLAEQWDVAAGFEFDEMSNTQYGQALEQCSRELMGFVKKNIPNINDLT